MKKSKQTNKRKLNKEESEKKVKIGWKKLKTKENKTRSTKDGGENKI